MPRKGVLPLLLYRKWKNLRFGRGKEMAKAKAKIKTKIKLKTKRSAAKRLKVTGTGKVMRRKGWKGHLLTGKNATRRRRLTGAVEITKDNVENIRQMLPYGSK
jgi:large subunit ribosomal protein L35